MSRPELISLHGRPFGFWTDARSPHIIPTRVSPPKNALRVVDVLRVPLCLRPVLRLRPRETLNRF